MKPFLGDQLSSDNEERYKVDFSPDHEEPHINAWMEVECQTPDGTETLSYMFIDGAYIRDHVFVDYVEGGHFYRYGWCPESQIWLEDEMALVDRFCTGIHETHERFRMKYLGWDYEKAHDSACVIERTVRRLVLEKGSIIPSSEGIGKIFALEGSGKSCEKLATELVQENEGKVNEANKQANNPVGKSS